MIRAAFILAVALLVSAEPVLAQGNDDDYTPLNSRIRRAREFPLEPRTFLDPQVVSNANRTRNRNMVDQFARCLWDRSNEDGISLLDRTDFGFVTFAQIGITNNDQLLESFPIETCLDRVGRTQQTGVRLSYTAEAIRRWYLQAAYLDTYPEGPAWAVPGNAAGARSYPLSANNPAVHTSLDFGDCVVAQDPHAADYFFRTAPESPEEAAAIQGLMPALSPCLPAGQQIELAPFALRVWLGEGLWHAARTSAPVPQISSQEAQ